MNRIDLHAHLIPKPYDDALGELGHPDHARREWSVERTLDVMNRYGIDAAVLSLSTPGVFFGDQGQANELARLVNEEAAAVVRSDPRRFGALAFLPLPDLDAALAELAYALDVLELDGVALTTNVGGTYLGDPSWDPLFDELERRGAYVFVHPDRPPYELPVDHPVWLYELPFQTTRAIVSLIYSGTLERCPSVKLQFAHLGGVAPFIAHRIAWLAARQPAFAERTPAGPLEYFRRLYFDTALSTNAGALAATLAVTSADRVVFGSDWPFADLPRDGTDPAPGLGALGAGERALVDGLNAAVLVPRLAA